MFTNGNISTILAALNACEAIDPEVGTIEYNPEAGYVFVPRPASTALLLDLRDVCEALVAEGGKIAAIGLFRRATGCRLVQAKDAIEALPDMTLFREYVRAAVVNDDLRAASATFCGITYTFQM